MSRVDGGLRDGGLGGLTAETLALQMGSFPVPGERGYPIAEAASPHDLISGFEHWIVGSADRLSSDRADVDDAEINAAAEHFAGLIEQNQGDAVALARLVRAGMVLAQPNLLNDADGRRQERLDEVTLLSAEYATAKQGDQVIRTGVYRYWGRLPSGIDGGVLEAPLTFRIGARGHHSNGNRNFAFYAEGAIPDPSDNAGGGTFTVTIPPRIGGGHGGHPHIGRRQIERVVHGLDTSLRNGEDAFLHHAGLVVALSGMRGPGYGERLDVLGEYFSAEQIGDYLERYNEYTKDSWQYPGQYSRPFQRHSLEGQSTIYSALSAMKSQARTTQ